MGTVMRILVVEDDIKLAEGLVEWLSKKGCAVDMVNDGAKAFTRISLLRNDYDLVVLDLTLPSMSGKDICRQMREADITTPILVLTARDEVEYRVELLMMGADDYLIKPFSFEELLARIRAILRRPNKTVPTILKELDIELNPADRTAKRRGVTLNLTLREFGLLEYFLRHPNEVINREDLITHLWDFNYESFSNVVDVHVKNLRQKLDRGVSPSVLETVRGIGYKLNTEKRDTN
ncbi:MAG: response regulator transcription factor [Parcubacteria group bacterium]